MTLTQLQYVVAVSNYRSFVAAAEKCFVTQPTLSMQIQKLEEELGVKLFDRNKHPIAVTAMGEAIVEQARNVLAQTQKISDIIQEQQGILMGTFHLGIIPTLAPYILPGLLETYHKNYPHVKLHIREIETDQIKLALRNNEIDAGVLSTPLEDKSSIKEYPLFYEPLVAYFSEKGNEAPLKKRMVSDKDIPLERVWLLNEGHCMRNQVLDLCSDYIQRLQIDRPYRYESSNVETLHRMVDTNEGSLTILPELATLNFNEDMIERVRYFEGPEPVREIIVGNQ